MAGTTGAGIHGYGDQAGVGTTGAGVPVGALGVLVGAGTTGAGAVAGASVGAGMQDSAGAVALAGVASTVQDGAGVPDGELADSTGIIM